MGNKAKVKLEPGQTYLFVAKRDTSSTISVFAMQPCTEWELYGLLNGKPTPIDGHSRKAESHNPELFECLGTGEFLGIQFNDGKLSVGLKNFLKKNPKHKKYFPQRKSKKSKN